MLKTFLNGKRAAENKKRCPFSTRDGKAVPSPLFIQWVQDFPRETSSPQEMSHIQPTWRQQLSATTELHLQKHKQNNSSKLPKLLNCKKQTAPALLGTTKTANSPADFPLKASYVDHLFAFTPWMPISESTPSPTPSPLSRPSTVPITCKKPAFIKWQPPHHIVHQTCLQCGIPNSRKLYIPNIM